ncbi:uncharacterized protein (DUF427 family) [Sphingopyxis panaciterrae]|uniref:DUF427 domain-containing protein n=1 Tax=Sphingopyxis panaciterrae TaxID=363841 RepID=UPI001421552B|nr:DUF427 domain-containing protein [Sphingopyxis panaciterrae]NIJ39645.1 uncharacterized protein (DUF427 family) [Sphingopyxis panaciterrae]
MVTARWNGVVIADSDDTVVVEGNHYFPRAAVDAALLSDSDMTSFCPWKGVAHYHHVTVGGVVNEDAAWYYPEPKEAASAIRGRIAFWKGVEAG